MKRQIKTLRSVLPNAGLRIKYRRRMEALIKDMHESTQYWIAAAYKQRPPRMAGLVDIAQDASPSDYIQKVMNDLAKRWIKRFEESADKMAESFLKDAFKHGDSSLRQALKDAGWSVQFTMTKSVRDAFNASLNENVGLIKSIPQQYLQKVEGIVMRSYTAGRDLETMSNEIQAAYPVTKQRAAFISRDQANKANAVVNRTRQLELGITQAVWMHSGAGKEARPSHLKAGMEKRVYNIAEGCYLDGEWIQPGELINCRCTSRPIIKF